MDGSEGEKGKKGGEDEEEDEANTRDQQNVSENVEGRKTPVTVQKPKDLPLKNIAPSTAADIHKPKHAVANSKIKTRMEPPIPKRRETSSKVSSIRKEPSPKRVSAEPKSPLAPRRSAELCPRHGGSQESLKDVGLKREDRRGGKSPVTPTRQSSDSSVRTSSKSPDPKPRKDSPGTKRKMTGKKEDSPKKLSTSPKLKIQGKENDAIRAGGETSCKVSSTDKTDATQKQKSDKKVTEKISIKSKPVQPKSPSSVSHISSRKSPVVKTEKMNIEGNETAESASAGSTASSTKVEKNLQSEDKAKDLLKQETQQLKEALKLPPASDAIGVKIMNQSGVTKVVSRDSKPAIPEKRDSEVPCVSKSVEDKHRHDKSPKSSDIEKLHDILTEKNNISVKEMLTLKNSTIQEQTKEFAITSRKEKRTQSEGSAKVQDHNFSSKRTPIKNEHLMYATDVKNGNIRSAAEMVGKQFSDESLTLERKMKDDQNNSIKGFPHAQGSQSDKDNSNANKIAFDSAVSKCKKISTGFMRAQSIAGIEIGERGKLRDSDTKYIGVNPLVQKPCNVRKGSLDTQEEVTLSKTFAASVSKEGKINNQLQKKHDQRSSLATARGHTNESNGGLGQRNEKSSIHTCKLISSDSNARVRSDENEKLQSDRDSLGCGGLQGRKCPIYFGVKSYLHQFYDSAPSKDPNYDYYEDEDDFEYMVDPSKRQKPCCCQGLWFRVGLWGGANLLLIGVIALLVGHLTPPRQTVVAFEDDLEVLDRWAIAFNHRLELCRLAGLAVFCCGGVVLLTTLLLSTITHARRETNIMRQMAPLVEPYDAIPAAAKIPITEKIRQVQPSLWPETAATRDAGLVQMP